MVKTRRPKRSRRDAMYGALNIEEDPELHALILNIFRILDAMPEAG
ncbi:uncharacterized protein LOC120320690 [Drosophila yakuba]|nr:uncharacterized protein LOC120320690 [Drosophila yakuba]XP_039479255.1 uncharacterized protein LOC120443894 [Drosophila santomea]